MKFGRKLYIDGTETFLKDRFSDCKWDDYLVSDPKKISESANYKNLWRINLKENAQTIAGLISKHFLENKLSLLFD